MLSTFFQDGIFLVLGFLHQLTLLGLLNKIINIQMEDIDSVIATLSF